MNTQMHPTNTFKRYEKKFLLSQEQFHPLHEIVAKHMPPDIYGEYLVQSLYYDTSTWDIIRKSIENPVYKEKMRLRCYGVPDIDSKVFLELKKKYKGIVNKRRISFPIEELHDKTTRDIASDDKSQIGKELDYYFKSNPVDERVHISYSREAFADGRGLRITFDTDIRFRTNLLDYKHPNGGLAILPDGIILMEVKTLGCMPLWMAQALSKFDIYPTSFSKYGVGYKIYVLQKGDISSWNILPKSF